MCEKLHSGDLNLGPCTPNPTSIYTGGMTTALKVCGSDDYIDYLFIILVT